MAKIFKKNQKIIAKLPDGRVVNGVYIEPYGLDGHSFYAMEYEGVDRNGEPKYKKVRYGVKDVNIEENNITKSEVSYEQYQAWLKRAIVLEKRISELDRLRDDTIDPNEVNRLTQKYERTNKQLVEISKKINDYEREYA